jgi:2-methylcitrate dehydratase PrpD
MEALNQLAQFVADTRYESLPRTVIDRAHWVIRDTLGAIIGGMAQPEVMALAEHALHTAPGTATLFGHGGRTTPAWAALVHGTAGTTLEMDEGHAYARGHAAIHAVPTALALGQALGSSGQDVLTAAIVGYEVAARAGIATRLRQSVHPFGAWGVLGAAAVSAWYRDFDATAVADALELAASYAIAPSFNTAYQGANVRNTFAGVVNRLGLLAVDLYDLGFRGEQGGLGTVFGEILGESFDPRPLVDGLGTQFEMMRGYFKPYSACRYTHAAVDAVLKLKGAMEIDAASISRIEVATYDIATHLKDPAPATPLAGRFSLPYVVAATLLNGSAGPEIFTEEILSDATVRDLAAKVRVREEEAFTAMTPARRPARVSIRFKDGRQKEETVTSSKGDPDQPMTEWELMDKFLRLVSPGIGSDRAEQAWHRFGQLSAEPSMEEPVSLLASLGNQ